MSEEERQDALKAMQAFNENRDSSSRGLGWRGRGNCIAQRPKADKSEAEARENALCLTTCAQRDLLRVSSCLPDRIS